MLLANALSLKVCETKKVWKSYGRLKCRNSDLGNDAATIHLNRGHVSNHHQIHTFIDKNPKRSRCSKKTLFFYLGVALTRGSGLPHGFALSVWHPPGHALLLPSSLF